MIEDDVSQAGGGGGDARAGVVVVAVAAGGTVFALEEFWIRDEDVHAIF